MIGTKLSHYEITAKLGEGGMGEVYRARDTKLGREVAIKVLPEAFTSDPERFARFEREAQVLASLNHPNIAGIYELAADDATHFLVLELAEGEDLAERLSGGSIPIAQALELALQIAEALEAAHDKGIVHRDLKPANIMIGPEGRVKVLDFGLAKAWEVDREDADDPSLSPTLTAQMTQAGTLLGTAAYMSPEQAKGLAVDKRADIWAFGVVLYEMLTGERLFAGPTAPETLASVLTREVDLEALPPATPATIRRLLGYCLEREPRNRLHDIADARIVIAETVAGDAEEIGSPGGDAVTAEPSRWRLLPWLVTALAVAVAAASWWVGRSDAPATSSIVATLPPPPGTSYYLRGTNPAPATLSHDGGRLVFGAVDADSVTRLRVRDLSTGEQRDLVGTEGAQYPFWSPDGEWIGFFSRREQSLRKIPATGGTPITICRAVDGKGGSWNRDGVILFSPNPGAPVYQVPAEGGEPTPVTFLEDERYNSHRHPRFLPDGRHFLYLARSPEAERSTVMLSDLTGSKPRALLDTATHAEYASGHLLFLREGTLLAQPFDPEALELSGSALSVATGVDGAESTGLALFSASQTGLLVIHRGVHLRPVQLELRDRSGDLLDQLATPRAVFRDMEFSPAGDRIAYSTAGASQDVYILDLAQRTELRFTLEPSE
ncbi:MAG: protein kinase, partial [Thermoanaerobaculia bacterium]|nr:protein kinase [Thermoanaerobaculia bacterium]